MTADARLALGAAAVLTVTQAADLLPWRQAVALRWLRRVGVVRPVLLEDPDTGAGIEREVVIWGDVLAVLGAGHAPAESRPAPRTQTMRRGL